MPEQFRLTTWGGAQDVLASTEADGNNGAFGFALDGVLMFAIASDGGGWEHVSLSCQENRTPTWDEMCAVKNLFWGPEDCVVQYHPPEADYVNCHPFTLHLWRQTGGKELPRPPKYMVGPDKN